MDDWFYAVPTIGKLSIKAKYKETYGTSKNNEKYHWTFSRRTSAPHQWL